MEVIEIQHLIEDDHEEYKSADALRPNILTRKSNVINLHATSLTWNIYNIKIVHTPQYLHLSKCDIIKDFYPFCYIQRRRKWIASGIFLAKQKTIL